ncbi:MAG: DNA-processing protein DprA [Acidimicrobiales bacterium]
MSAAELTLDTAADRGAAAALAGLPSMGPRRLAAILEAWPPEEAWARIATGDPSRLHDALTDAAPAAGVDRPVEAVTRAWSAAARDVVPAAVLHEHVIRDVRILLRHDAAYPDVLAADIEPPSVLFVRGDLRALDGPRVAIVGTRRCTGVGAGMARELGRELAVSGVVVVSGLALGIDGAAHRGVLDARAGHPDAAPPAGVVGSGLDVVYPARHRELWAAVAEQGVLLSEAPVGCRPSAWRFPARNRIIAALADVVVVVESHATGGSLHTVTEALRRDVDVMAVPGSVRSSAAAGANQLLADGCHPVRDAGDVLVALGMTPAARRRSVEHRAAPSTVGDTVLRAFDWEPATFEHLAVRTGLPLPELALVLEGLVADGWVSADGGWYERVAAR